MSAPLCWPTGCRITRARTRCCWMCANPGSCRPPASRPRALNSSPSPWVSCPRASPSSIRRGPSPACATTACAACAWPPSWCRTDLATWPTSRAALTPGRRNAIRQCLGIESLQPTQPQPMKAFPRRVSSALGTCALYALCATAVGTVQAQSLSALVEQARGYDAAWLAAQAQLQAAGSRAEQARAGLLPSAALTGGANYSRTDMTRPPLPDVRVNSPGQTVGVQAAQALYR